MKKLRLNSNGAGRKVACTVSAAALMLGVSQAATIGLKFTVDYCGFGNYVNYVNAPAFGMATNLWQNLTAMGTGYHSCSSYTSFSLTNVISASTVNIPPGGLHPLPNGSITVSWFGSCANWSGFAGYDSGSANQPTPASGPPKGEAEVYAGFIRDGVNFGPGSSGPPVAGDNNQPGYYVDIVGMKSVFTNNPFVVQLVAAADSMQTLTNAFVIDATHSTTQSVTYPATQVYGNVGDTTWFRAIGGGLSTVSTSVDADHIEIIGNRAAHSGTYPYATSYNRGSTISGVIITDKPVVTMAPRSVLVCGGDNLTLNPYAIGVGPLSYQWRKGGVPISGATLSTLSFPSPQVSDSGSYDLVVTNLYGRTTSAVSVVTVDSITFQTGPSFVVDSKPSGTELDGVASGATWVASSTDSASHNRSGVMSFNGANGDSITEGAATNFNAANGAIMFWMRCSAPPSGSTNILFNRHNGGSGLAVAVDPSGVLVVHAGNGANDSLYVTPVADNKWHHIVLNYDQSGAGHVVLTVDGVLDGQAGGNTSGWGWDTGQQIVLGTTAETGYNNYTGLLDDFRVYDRELTGAEILSAYLTDALVDTAALMVRLNFDAAPLPGFVLSWKCSDGVLQSATSLSGPWTDLSAKSPYAVAAQNGQKFFRYRHTSATVVSNPYLM